MNNKITATWFHATSSQAIKANLWFENGFLYADNQNNETIKAAISELKISARIATIPRNITIGNVTLVVDNNDFIDKHLTVSKNHVLYLLETRWQLILGLLPFFILTMFLFIQFAIPKLSEVAANQLSISYLTEVTDEIYDQLTSTSKNSLVPVYLTETKLSEYQQQRVTNIFNTVSQDFTHIPYNYRLKIHGFFHNSANAFALPDGLIVATDALVLNLNNDELEAVLAHEIGHVNERHGMRSFIQSTALGLFLILIGDVSGFAAIPLALTQSRYSRKAEQEADCFAARYLKQKGKSPDLLGTALLKIESTYSKPLSNENSEEEESLSNENNKEEESLIIDLIQLLSSHPETEDRQNLEVACQLSN